MELYERTTIWTGEVCFEISSVLRLIKLIIEKQSQSKRILILKYFLAEVINAELLLIYCLQFIYLFFNIEYEVKTTKLLAI